jgi:NADH-quinone oxidoreductase subunit H
MAAVEPTPGTLDPILRKPITLLILILVAFGAPAAGLATAIALFPAVGEFFQGLLSNEFSFKLIVMLLVWQLIMGGCALCILAERKLSAYMQDRMGPNRVGFLGVLQPIADGLKFLLKEDIIPRNVDKPLFLLAPAMALIVALIGFIIIPFTGPIQWPWMAAGESVTAQVVSIEIGFLFLLAVNSLSVYGVVLAGYASNNKYSFYGGMRATAQMISYEVPLGLGLLAVLLITGTLRPEVIVAEQAATGVWNVFLQPVIFMIVLIAVFAETNRLPFDLAESEQELVGGFHTEYSAMKFSMFFLGEYAHMITASALIVALFFGGGAPLPFVSWLGPHETVGWVGGLVQFGVFWVKVALFIAFFMVVRWTIPRFRYDQLMRLAWKGMIPLGVAMVVITAALVALGYERNLLVSLGVNVLAIIGVLLFASRSTTAVTGRQAHMPYVQVRPSPRPNP